MPEPRVVTLEVLRYQPEGPREPYVERFEVACTDDMSVLQALQEVKDRHDASLTFRWSCRMAICGSCGMMIDGVPRLACQTFVRDLPPGPVRIEALENFPIERDLVVDAGDFMAKLPAIRPWIVPARERAVAEGENLQTPRQLERFESFSHCINCMLCYAACPQYGLDKRFLGPGLTALLLRYNEDSRDAGQAERMELANSDAGVWSCTAVGACSTVCPKGVDPANAVNRTKSAGAVSWLARLARRGG
jgi:fumarate reductase iron-sulfur subunit